MLINRRLLRRLGLAKLTTFAALAIAFAGITVQANKNHDQGRQAVLAYAQSSTELIANSISAGMLAGQLALRAASDDAAAGFAAGRIADRLEHRLRPALDVSAVAVVAPDGSFEIRTTRQGRDPPWFTPELRRDLVSEAMRLPLAVVPLADNAIAVARRLTNPEGRFAGIALIVRDPAALRQYLYDALPETASAATLANTRLEPLVQVQKGTRLTGLAADPVTYAGRQTALFVQTAGTETAVYTFRRLPDAPMNIGLALDLDAAIGGTYRDAVTGYLGLGLIGTVLMALAHLADRRERQRRAAGVRLRRKAAMLEGSSEALETDARRVAEVAESLATERQAAIDASQAKSRFIANMSHELRTPLNAIIGFSEVIHLQLFGTAGQPRYREYAEHIYKSGQHLLTLVERLLEAGQGGGGPIHLALTEIDLSEIATEVEAMHRRQIDLKRLRYGFEIELGARHLIADAQAIKQVLINLISNAIKFTPEAGSVSVVARLSAPDQVAVVVSDSGIGIAQDALLRIFEPFEQVRGSGFNQMGTGLGLSISKALVEAHGGNIYADSAPGRGTRIVFTLPTGGPAPPPGAGAGGRSG